MYELLIVAGFGWFSLKAFDLHQKNADAELPQKMSERISNLWKVVHQGIKDNRLLRAEKALLTILKIYEKNAAAYNRLGILYAKQKEYKDAIDCFEIATGIEASASSLHNLGLIYYETENFERAVIAFEHALELDDTMAARHIALAKALEHVGNEKLMLEHLEKAADLEPTKESYILLAKGYRQMGKEDQADITEDKIKRLGSKKIPKKKIMKIRRPKRVVL